MTLTNAEIYPPSPRRRTTNRPTITGSICSSTTGTRSWRYKDRFGGKEKLLCLGLYPDVALAKARDRHGYASKFILVGTDPALEAKRNKAVLVATADATFKKVAEL